jgi:hypothetical protein
MKFSYLFLPSHPVTFQQGGCEDFKIITFSDHT